tara:strand:+ start:32006 stop:32140 length:135 start_codon:yes stop_codon:yes gene_type:complete
MLERHLDMKLFVRARDGLHLTNLGRMLLPSMRHCLRMLSLMVGR